MRKIPTIFERDWNGDRSRVIDQVHPDCKWVFADEGRATIKLDGTCAMVRAGKLFRRREIKNGDSVPPDFELADKDDETGKIVGWLPVGDGPEDRWFREAFAASSYWDDGTYELIGPKVQGNPEGAMTHMLVKHGNAVPLEDPPTDFAGLSVWLSDKPIEGIVWHHPDGRMAKIKLRDFGLARAKT